VRIDLAWKKQVASPVCLSQESHGFGLRDNKRCNSGSDGAMNVIEDDYVIEKLFATASDAAFRNSILPRACRAYAHGFHAVPCQQIGQFLAKLDLSCECQGAVLSFWSGPEYCFGKVKRIQESLKIDVFDPRWTLASRLADNPRVWQIMINWLVVDVREAPREIQEERCDAD
jgi:hypothetical protein